MMALGGLLAVVAGLLHDLAQLALAPSGLTTLALGGGVMLAGVVLAAALVLLTSVSRPAAAIPALRRACALRRKSARAAFSRQRDPDAAGRARPRAPSAAPAAAGLR